MSSGFILAEYLIETPGAPEAAAAAIAGEQSAGTFTKVPLEDDQLWARAGAIVRSVETIGTRDRPTLRTRSVVTSSSGTRFTRAKVTLEFPADNVGTDLAQLITTVAGNLFELDTLTGIRLERLSLPATLTAALPGGRFAVGGTRDLLEVRGRPLIGTIIKPSIGLRANDIADLVFELAIAGLDFIKDDELQGNPTHAPFEARVRAVCQALDRASQVTGRRCMYAFNLSGDLEQMLHRHELVVSAGGLCVMVNIHAVGFSATRSLCHHSEVPVHAHRAGFGAVNRHPLLGISSEAMQTLVARSGADHYHTSGLANKFWEDDDSVVDSIHTCLKQGLMPVLSSGQHPGVVHETFRRVGSIDLIHLAGGGILAHPDGSHAGVEAMQAAWEAAIAGEPLERARGRNHALHRSIERFGVYA
jgi:ribulose-bisphosphate carboxylase large chain